MRTEKTNSSCHHFALLNITSFHMLSAHLLFSTLSMAQSIQGAVGVTNDHITMENHLKWEETLGHYSIHSAVMTTGWMADTPKHTHKQQIQYIKKWNENCSNDLAYRGILSEGEHLDLEPFGERREQHPVIRRLWLEDRLVWVLRIWTAKTKQK